MNFEKAQKSYDENAVVQFEMAKKIGALIEKHRPKAERILEIGCGTGFLTEHLIELFDGGIFLNDINQNQTRLSAPFIQGDIMDVEIPKNLDLIASNAVFQWINEPGRLFEKLHNSLRHGGMLIFSTFGEENYKQFKNFGGINYLKINEIEKLVTGAGLEISHLEEQIFTTYFASPREVLAHIKATGVTTFKGGMWSKSALSEFEQKYLAQNLDKNGVELTYHPIFCVCKVL